MISSSARRELEQFIAAKAPGLTLSMEPNLAFDSHTLGLGIKIDLRRLISNAVAQQPERLADEVMAMLAEVQKATVTAIGLEEYVRERELAVLDRLQEKLDYHFQGDEDVSDPMRQAREELGG